MKLIYEKYGIFIEIIENQVVTLVIENQKVFSEFVQNLNQQINGDEGELILSDEDKELSFSKQAVLVTNPFTINCNEKRIVNKLYKELQDATNETLVEHYAKINSVLVNFVDEIISMVPYNLTYDLELDLLGVLKLFNVRIDNENVNLLEMMIDYIRALKTICGIQIVAVLNIKCFFTADQLKELYKFCFYEKVFLINIQGNQFFHMEEEKCYIIDKDLCFWEA